MASTRHADPPFKGVTVVFDNGYFANVPFLVSDEQQWASLGDAGIDRNGNLVFADGRTFGSIELYRRIVDALRQGNNGEEPPRLPVAGPWIRFRRYLLSGYANQFSTLRLAKPAKSSVLRVIKVKSFIFAIAAIWPSA